VPYYGCGQQEAPRDISNNETSKYGWSIKQILTTATAPSSLIHHFVFPKMYFSSPFMYIALTLSVGATAASIPCDPAMSCSPAMPPNNMSIDSISATAFALMVRKQTHCTTIKVANCYSTDILLPCTPKLSSRHSRQLASTLSNMKRAYLPKISRSWSDRTSTHCTLKLQLISRMRM
jgi:hypothetical protein